MLRPPVSLKPAICQGAIHFTLTVVTIQGRLAQLGEHLPYKQGVIGSSPIVPTKSTKASHSEALFFYWNIPSVLNVNTIMFAWRMYRSGVIQEGVEKLEQG